MPITYGDGSSGTYKPIKTVLSNQPANPVNQVNYNNPLPELKPLGNKPTPLTAAEQARINFNQTNVANNLVNSYRNQPTALQQISAKGGAYAQAVVDLQTRQGSIPKLDLRAAPKPVTPQPVSAPTSAASQPTLATAANVGKGLVIAGAGTVGALPATVSFAGAVTSALLLKVADSLGEIAVGKLKEGKLKEVEAKAEARYQKALANQQKANPVNTKGLDPLVGVLTPGQSSGVSYVFTFTVFADNYFTGSLSSLNPFTITSGSFTVTGPISVGPVTDSQGRVGEELISSNGTVRHTLYLTNPAISPRLTSSIARSDGSPEAPPTTPGQLPTDLTPKEKPVNQGASPDFFPWLPVIQVQNDPLLAYKDAFRGESPSFDNRPFKEPEKALFAPTPAIEPTPTASPTPLPSTVSSPATGSRTTNPVPVSTTPTNPSISPSQSPNNLISPLTPPTVAKPQGVPNTPSSVDLGNIATVLGTIGLGVTAIEQKTNKIDSQTTPEAQQTNAKQGVCDAMQPQQCGFEGVKQATTEATAPIKDQAIANGGAISSVLNLLATVWEFLQNRIGKILSILNNSVVDRSLAVMSLATNIHNAAMLTRDIGETLGSVVDNVISLTGLRFTNSEGATLPFTDFIGSNFRAFLVSVLGVENYTSLILNWQKANTIYHSAMAVVNTTQSMLDPISSAVEYGMENVSKIGNSLKEDGVVSENAYPAMDETIRARRVNRFERLNDTLEGAENIASNLSSITSSAVSVKEDYKQLREDSKDLKDKASAFNTADSEARAALKAELPTEITAITLAPAPAEDEE